MAVTRHQSVGQRRLRLLSAAAFLLAFHVTTGTSLANAENVRVNLVPDGLLEDGQEATLLGVPVASPDGDEKAWLLKGGSSIVSLDSRHEWVLRVRGSNLWSAEQVWRTGQSELDLQLYRLASIRGTLLLNGKSRPEGNLAPQISFRTARGVGRADKAGTEGTLGCEQSMSDIDCPIPEGRWDVAVRVDGFAPVHYWGLNATPMLPRDVGIVGLYPGSSIAGWLTFPPGTDMRTVSVFLRPGTHSRALESEAGDLAQLERRVECNQDGFFQFTSLPEGSYRVFAEGDGVRSQTISVALATGEELTFPHPLQLRRLQPVRFVVEPATGPAGQPWRLQILRMQAPSHRAVVDAGEVANDGFWQSEPLAPGDYFLELSDATGSRWYYEELPVDEMTPDPVLVTATVVMVEGVLSIGGERSSGAVFFGGKRGIQSIRMIADEEGEFRGFLPRAGTWQVDAQLTESPAVVSAGTREIARVDGDRASRVVVDLPNTRMTGRVVREGRGVKAIVLGVRTDTSMKGRERVFELTTDAGGRFEVNGLAPETLEVRARDADAESAAETVTLQEGIHPSPLVLRLGDSVSMRGRVVLQGRGVPGALVAVQPDAGSGLRSATSVDGSFDFDVPAEASVIDLVVVPPMGGIRLARLRPQGGAEVTFEVAAGSGIAVFPFIRGTIVNSGSEISLHTLLRALEDTGRLEIKSDGYFMHGLAIGPWLWCPDRGVCHEGVVFSGAEMVFDSH